MLSRICPKCSYNNEENACFCAECGCNLKEDTIKHINNIKTEKTRDKQEISMELKNEIKADKSSNSPIISNTENTANQNKNTINKGKNKAIIFVLIASTVILTFFIFSGMVYSGAIGINDGTAIKKYQMFLINLFESNVTAEYADPDIISYTDRFQKESETTIWNPDNDETIEAQTESNDNKYVVDVGASNLNLRSEKTAKSKILHSIPNNTELTITAIEDGWGYTTYKGKSGWVNMDYLKNNLRFTVKASSILKSQAGFNYFPQNIVDNNKNTCWAEGISGDGIGETIVVSCEKEFTFNKIKIYNGYCKSKELFNDNNRPKILKLSFDNGQHHEAFLKDGYENHVQEIDVSKITTKNVTIEIIDVYEGNKFKDTCISDIVFS